MIIRKPYAFLIKNFKRIHLLITLVLVFLIFRSHKLYAFIKGLTLGTSNRRNGINFIDYGLIFVILVVLVAFGLIYYLMRHKKKPKFIYMASIIGYFAFIVVLVLVFNYFGVIKSELVEQKTVRIFRDLFRFLLAFQYIITIFMLVRGLGFDIKKFDFKKDLRELDISDVDSEEVEVNVNVNTNGIGRFFRKIFRKLGYYFQENRLVISGIIVIVCVIIGVSIYKGFKGGKSYVDMNTYFNSYAFTMKVNDSYITNYDEDGSKLDNYYVVVSFNVKGITNNKNSISETALKLKVGNSIYYPDKGDCSYFGDLGGCYMNRTISNYDYRDYILVYKIGDRDLKKKMTFIYEYGYSEKDVYSFNVRINPKNLYSSRDVISAKVGDEVSFANTALSSGKFRVNSYEGGKSLEYMGIDSSCAKAGCEKEVVKSISSDNFIMKLDYTSDISNIFGSRLFLYYTRVGYSIDGANKSTFLKRIKVSNTKYMFLEGPSEMENADKIWLDFSIRNSKIRYYLK